MKKKKTGGAILGNLKQKSCRGRINKGATNFLLLQKYVDVTHTHTHIPVGYKIKEDAVARQSDPVRQDNRPILIAFVFFFVLLLSSSRLFILGKAQSPKYFFPKMLCTTNYLR